MAYTTVNKSTDYFNTFAYAGTGSTNTKTGVGFKPDWIWVKNRSDSEDHLLMDVLRTFASGKGLRSNGSDEEGGVGTSARGWVVATSDGFTTNSGSSNSNLVNDSGNNYVAWNWKAGTTGSGTSSGSGTGKAYTYSVSTTAGFSVVKYVGNGTAGHTIPHHLGAVPKMIITKNLGRGEHWRVYHASLGNAQKLNLNNTTASASASEWNSTTPTSSVFSIGTGEQINYNNDNYIAYCFADITGYSKIGSYTGNGNADGAFIYTGFKPAFTLIKRSAGGTESWYINDNKRSVSGGDNPNHYYLLPNDGAAEGTSTSLKIDLLSNGFKIRNTDTSYNTSGSTYIFMSFAEAPLVGSNNVPANAR